MERKAVIDLDNYDKAIEILRAHNEMWSNFVIRLLEEEPDDEDD